jgi:hypothetical protein
MVEYDRIGFGPASAPPRQSRGLAGQFVATGMARPVRVGNNLMSSSLDLGCQETCGGSRAFAGGAACSFIGGAGLSAILLRTLQHYLDGAAVFIIGPRRILKWVLSCW